MIKHKHGFTLTELLAVVLIIALLTAVALPQYRRVITRAEAMEALSDLKTIFESAKRYRAARAQSPTNFKQLDISLFNAQGASASVRTTEKFVYTLTQDGVSALRNDPNSEGSFYQFNFYYNKPDYGGRDVLTCKYGGNKYSWLCPALGTTELASQEYLIE